MRGCRVQFRRTELGHEFAGCEGVVVTAIPPKELGVVSDLVEYGRINVSGVRQNLFEQMLDTQPVSRVLVVNNGIDGNRSHGEPISEYLLLQRLLFETFGVKLQEARIANTLDQAVRHVIARRAAH